MNSFFGKFFIIFLYFEMFEKKLEKNKKVYKKNGGKKNVGKKKVCQQIKHFGKKKQFVKTSEKLEQKQTSLSNNRTSWKNNLANK